MTTPSDLRERIAQAIRDAAYDCPGGCDLTEAECDARHPIQVSALRHGVVASVYGEPDALAASVLAVVEPELAVRDEEIARLRTEIRLQGDALLRCRTLLASAAGIVLAARTTTS
ncbi:hypothetical protein [Kitasatospora sp. NPDC056184]|uniref:hypothetical protein n=1 Tax=Kitasatospora sp. NPDC056184 TaxID=3345738 RepID=UPI0035DB4620